MARDEGVPAYAILTNPQLVEITQRRPTSRAELTRVPGLGKKKVERHGAANLEVLGSAAVSPSARGADS